MSTNSSDPQNHSTLHYHTSLNDGTGNNESAAMHSNFTRYVEPQWDERSQTNSMIFLVLVALWWVHNRIAANALRNKSTKRLCQIFYTMVGRRSLCVMLFKITCWKGSEQESSRRISGIRVASVHGGNKEIKTEEYITNRLVLKVSPCHANDNTRRIYKNRSLFSHCVEFILLFLTARRKVRCRTRIFRGWREVNSTTKSFPIIRFL